MKHLRRNHALCLFKNEVYVFGGRNQTEWDEDNNLPYETGDFGEAIDLNTHQVDDFYFTEALRGPRAVELQEMIYIA